MRIIATILQLSPRTVETYVEQIKYKMGCSNKAEIIEQAIAKTMLILFIRKLFQIKLQKYLRNRKERCLICLLSPLTKL